MSKTLLLVLALSVGGTVCARAEVRMLVQPDGTRLLYNYADPGRLSQSGSSTTVQSLRRLVAHYATRRNLDPRLVEAVVRVESDYNPKARSRKGAMGLMQLMPATARQLGVRNAYDPGENIRGGTLYLKRMLDRFDGDLELALAGYNAGPSVVERYGGVPPYRETVNYVRRVLTLYTGGSSQVLHQRRGRPVFVRRDSSSHVTLSTTP